MKSILPITLIFLLLAKIVPNLQAQPKEKIYENKSFQPFVGTVQLYPVTDNPNQELEAPIVPRGNVESLLLQFDLLLEEYIDVQVKIIHCNADWTKSVLNDIEFLYDYNSFDLRDFEYSINTKTLFVNYWFNIPRVKTTGNYIVQVYQNGDEKDLLFTRRFIVFDNNVSIQPTTRISTGVIQRDFNQQIDFDIIHSRIKVSNPRTEFKIVIRQNQRWDNMLTGLQPTAVRRDKSLLEYRHFNMENNFKGGNEFRMADLRSYSFRGAYVSNVNPDANPREATVNPGKSRKHQAYSQMLDKNGGFIIASTEALADYLECDYIKTKFQVKSDRQVGSVYILGAFNDYNKDEKSLMKYDDSLQAYTCDVLLKQGLYDYLYWADLKNNDPYYFEGSFYQTENNYDIIVYHKSFSDLTDKVVGYYSFRTKF
ncbi:MAG: type IX secretion system plug protein domain-containing protein [Reichenbachiella sp.]|uniref:type IX secretion system plug protein n=1 Tax=Reichenbachiella sp. TaxID=2184521 RepID=UPI003267FBA2